MAWVARLKQARVWFWLLLVTLGACASEIVNPRVPPPGSELFQDAYVKGCLAGYVDARRAGYHTNYEKDALLYDSEIDYRSGWDQGHAACYEDEIRYPHVFSLGIRRRIM